MRTALASLLMVGASAAQGELLSVTGRSAGELLGACVGVAGDLDGDGVREWLVARGGETPTSQRPELLVLSGADGHTVYDLFGAGPINELFLQAVLELGDVDGDGVSDFAFGNSTAFVSGHPNRGRVSVFSGARGARLYFVEGQVASGAFGGALARLGDLDGDARADYVVGQIGTQDENAWLVSGASGAFLGHVSGPRGGDPEFGWSVASVGDLDLDGRADFAVGTLRKGVVYVHSSASGRLLTTLSAGRSFGRQLADLGDLDGDGFHELVVAESARRLAWIASPRTGGRVPIVLADRAESVACAGDLDGDGRNDFLVSDASAGDGAGSVRAYSTRTLRELAKLVGPYPGAHLGAGLAGGADFDGDHRPELVLGAPGVSAGLRGGAAGAAGVWKLGPLLRAQR